VADAVTKLREICMALPDVSERAHFGEACSTSGKDPSLLHLLRNFDPADRDVRAAIEACEQGQPPR